MQQYPAPRPAQMQQSFQLPHLATLCQGLHISLFPGRSQPPRIGGVSLSLPHTPSWHPGHPLMARLAGKGDLLKLQSISTQVGFSSPSCQWYYHVSKNRNFKGSEVVVL